MGENGRKALYMAVGIFFALVILSAGIGYYLKASPVLEKSNSKMDVVTTQLDIVEFKSFDNTTISGSEVISAVNTKASNNITVMVKTKGNQVGKAYNSGSYNIKAITDKDYIEATAQFKAEIQKTDNGTVTGLTFTQL